MQEGGAQQPEFELLGNFFKVTRFPINGEVNEVWEFIKAHPGHKTSKIGKVLIISQRTIAARVTARVAKVPSAANFGNQA